MNQRWLFRQDRYRIPTETIRTAEYDVAPIAVGVSKAFVTTHHYSASFPASRFNFGLHHRGQLVGVAVFSVPMRWEVLQPMPGAPRESVELGRLVLLDQVPGNGETWFLARCFEGLRAQQIRGVVSFSDPTARTTIEGRRIFPGHVGTIYQALNGCFVGRSKARTLRLLPNGCVFAERAQSKVRANDQGRRYAAQQLEAFGATPIGDSDPGEWLAKWKEKLTRPLKHPGNLKYAWVLNRRDRKVLPETLDYLKLDEIRSVE